MTDASSVPSEAQSRQAVVQAALSWCRTPYHHAACVKGAGIDCLHLIYAAYLEAGLIEPIEFPYYSSQWGQHRSEETFLEGLLARAHEVQEPKPGDVVLYKFGRTYSHGGLIGAGGWPEIIHANGEAGFVMVDDGTSSRMADAPRKFFSFW